MGRCRTRKQGLPETRKELGAAVTPDPRWADRAVALGCQLVSMSNETIALKLGVDAVKTKFADRFLS